MDITQFPLLLDAISSAPRQQTNFTDALAVLSKGLADGQIANVDFQDAKQSINRALEAAKSKLNAVYLAERENRDNQADLDIYYSEMQAHTLNSTIARAKKSTSDFAKQTLEIATEALPLAEALKTLKDKIQKRVPKVVVDPSEKYRVPDASKTAMKQVFDALTAVTDAAYDDVKASFVHRYTRYVKTYMKKCREAEANGKALSAAEIYNNRRNPETMNQDAYSIIYLCVTDAERDRPYKEDNLKAPAILNKDWKETIDKEATRIADLIRNSFVNKNLTKFDSIVDGKGNFKSIEVVANRLNLYGLTGTFELKFTDGSSFLATNSVVWVMNSHGTQFFRYPLNFNTVRLPDGSIMGRPSEERMNTVFLGKS